MLNITYEDRTTNIWVKERTQVIPCHHLEETQLQDRRRGRAAKWWRDDLDKYWSDTIWQRRVNTGQLGGGMPRPLPTHGTLRLPNHYDDGEDDGDDDDDDDDDWDQT